MGKKRIIVMRREKMFRLVNAIWNIEGPQQNDHSRMCPTRMTILSILDKIP
jgi:hypothetical protein